MSYELWPRSCCLQSDQADKTLPGRRMLVVTAQGVPDVTTPHDNVFVFFPKHAV